MAKKSSPIVHVDDDDDDFEIVNLPEEDNPAPPEVEPIAEPNSLRQTRLTKQAEQELARGKELTKRKQEAAAKAKAAEKKAEKAAEKAAE